MQNAFAYMHNYGKNLTTVKWTEGFNQLSIAINSSNFSNLDTPTINQIIQDSISEWNGKSKISISSTSTIGVGQNGLNEIYFSEDPTIFTGSGIAGVTLITFKENTSEILESDIVINAGISFHAVKTAQLYLGNVVTHELGHFIGLSHSQVHNSSMFYQLSHGQHKVKEDDKAGIYSLYPLANLNKTALTGKIIGGKNHIPIFGAHVEAISESTGKVAASNITNFDGTFKIDGLNKNENYFIYTAPMSKTGITPKYARARFDFCPGSKNYRGSFYQRCEKKYQGYPQIINVKNQTSTDLGNITIRCDLDSPSEFITNKIGNSEFNLKMQTSQGIGNSFVGFFTKDEAMGEVKEEFLKVDLSDQILNQNDGDLFLEFKITNQALYSPYVVQVAYERIDGLLQNYESDPYDIESDGTYNSDKIVRIPIDLINQENNVFNLRIKPFSVTSTLDAVTAVDERLFPSAQSFSDKLYFYFVNASIVRSNLVTNSNDKYNPRVSSIIDNSSCTDAPNTYALSEAYLTAKSDDDGRKIEKATSCGSIDTNTRGGGPGGFLVGLALSFMVATLISKFNSQYHRKHVGNLA